MTRRPVLTFRPHGFDAEVAKLGERTVGYVRAREPRGWCWGVGLTDWPRMCGPAASVAAGRACVADQVSEWAASAGLIDPGAGVDIRLDPRLDAADEECKRA